MNAPVQPVKNEQEQTPAPQNAAAGIMPHWLVENSSRITNAGLMTGTAIMLHSGYRGKQISTDIWNAQLKEIGNTPGMTSQRAAALTDFNIKNKNMLKPGWHVMRTVYLLTALASFAIGAAFKRKEETPEEQERLSNMSLPEYMRTRVQQSFDPLNHSRQTVGVVSGISGAMAIMSAFTQPGGISKAELYIGSTLASGGAALAFLNNPQTAQNTFSALWLARIPAIAGGWKSFTTAQPVFKSPFRHEILESSEHKTARAAAAVNGVKKPIWFGLSSKEVKGEEALKAFDAAAGGRKLEYARNDLAYVTGQMINLGSALIGFAGKAAAKKPQDAAPATKPQDALPPVMPPVKEPTPPVADEAIPAATIQAAAENSAEKLQPEPAKKLGTRIS